ncbi:venom metalloproteinase antarease-like TtrivMP_A [Dermacentor silvarum]|uniref:venom metalloproteinase antarease-like TtrivMP_A n=1 Tax=Dermacentor silvarum TaxID=543639 RepID=UPI00189B3BDA|nr:venom metalloproteinase antarease-like TtrivMP_A [Dermacentor silvarum]
MYFVGVFLLWVFSANGLEEPKLVYPRLLEERSSDGAMVMRVHDQLTLNLRKASVAAPELRVLTEEDGETVTHIYNGEDIEKDLYEDEDNIATVAVTRDEYGVYMNGLVGPKHRIEPRPFAERSEDGVVPHTIYEIEQHEMLDRTLRHTEGDEKPVISERWNQQPVTVPDSVQIELFFVSDGPHHRHFPSNQALLVYLCVMANSVGLRYRAAKDPRISLIVTGVEMSKIEPYADLYPQNPNYIYDEGTLRKLRDYAYNNTRKYSNPDVVYLITGRDVYAVLNGKATVNGLGIGFVSSVCTTSFVALGEDKPGLYTGMHTLTHELAHVLGSEHDGEAPKTVGHPGARNCPWDAGNIMSYIDKGPSHHQFSTCSLLQMQYVIRKAGPICWAVSSTGYVVQATYPGMIVSQLAYCKEVVQDATMTIESYRVMETTCKVRCMFYKYERVMRNNYYTYYKRSFYQDATALDYTTCGGTKVCIQGVCVAKPNEPAAPTTRKSQPVTVKSSTEAPTIPTAITTPQCPCDCSKAAPPRPAMYPPRSRNPRQGTGTQNSGSGPRSWAGKGNS